MNARENSTADVSDVDKSQADSSKARLNRLLADTSGQSPKNKKLHRGHHDNSVARSPFPGAPLFRSW